MPDDLHESLPLPEAAMGDLEREALGEIRSILARDLGVDRPVGSNEELQRDLDLDSMALTVLAVGLEDHFRVILTGEDSARTVADLAQLVASRAAARAA